MKTLTLFWPRGGSFSNHQIGLISFLQMSSQSPKNWCYFSLSKKSQREIMANHFFFSVICYPWSRICPGSVMICPLRLDRWMWICGWQDIYIGLYTVYLVLYLFYMVSYVFFRYGFNVSTMCDLCSTRRILRSMDPPYRDNGNFSPMLALVDIWRFPRIGVLPNNPL